MITEINANHLKVIEQQDSFSNNGFIITNSNCSVSGLAIVLHSLKNSNISFNHVFVSTYQALSGAGFEGLTTIPRDRVIPFIDKEEEKMSIEFQKILGCVNQNKIVPDTSYDLLANCARVPIEDGHLEAVTIKLNDEISLNAIKTAFQSLNGYGLKDLPTAPEQPIVILEGPDRPQSTLDLFHHDKDRALGMVVSVGRLRLTGKYLRFYLLLHNTIRGGAGGSVLNAELALQRGYL